MSDDNATATLFDALVPPGPFRRFLTIGFESLPPDEQAILVDQLQEAQRGFIGACYVAALESDRIEHVCPNTPSELLDEDTLTIRFLDDRDG
jgi:hypothetical protein